MAALYNVKCLWVAYYCGVKDTGTSSFGKFIQILRSNLALLLCLFPGHNFSVPTTTRAILTTEKYYHKILVLDLCINLYSLEYFKFKTLVN